MWLKARAAEAIRLRTRTVALAHDAEFRAVVDWARREPCLGGRIGRDAYERMIEARDREWLDPDEGPRDLETEMQRIYRQQELQP